MVRIVTLCAVLIAPLVMTGILAASAQPAAPPTENVTVSGTKSREVIDKFVKSLVAPTAINGKIARWEHGICPLTVGQKPAFTAFVTARVKAVAAAVGAPVSALQSCTPNIEIIFTTAPQDLLDHIRKDDPDYLGYAESSAGRTNLATVTRPIQAWYLTEIKDANGMTKVDSGQRNPGGVHLGPNYYEFAISSHRSGNLTGNGVRSAFNHIVIAVDSKKLAGQNFVSLADYIAMLALTQLNAPNTCQPLSSIVNMMASDCDQRVDGITSTDLAYLRGLYKMGADQSLVYQRNAIADGMNKALGGQ